MKNRWLLEPQPKEEDVLHMEQLINVPEALAVILLQRGINTFDLAKAYFRPSLEKLHDPFLMKDMDVAIDRLQKAIRNQENILIYGDYDVDGTTAVTLVYEYLSNYYSNLSYYIPDRYKEGYGVSVQSIDFAHDNDVSLIIALDCGIKALDKIEYAKTKGIDYIICDHHLPGKDIPNAVAVLDPKRKDCPYPYKELSGCGVGFKLMHAFAMHNQLPFDTLEPLFDLLAVSIAADIVPITGENRILAYFGLKRINENPRPGFAKMIPDNIQKNLNISNLVFTIAPKINAAGRIEHAYDAVRLMLSSDDYEAVKYLNKIKKLNERRRDLDSDITDGAIEQLSEIDHSLNYTTVVYDPEWNKGVIGIVASRLVDLYYKPTLVFTKGNDGELVASARSVKGFDLYQALNLNSQFLEKFGGHMAAAGLTLKEENFLAFRESFEETVKNSIQESQRIPTIEIDKEIKLKEISSSFKKILHQMGPFGPENMNPTFLSKDLVATDVRAMGKDGEHLRFLVHQRSERMTFTAIGFKLGNTKDKLILGVPFDAVYTLEQNYWQGKATWQMNIKDIRFHE
ncbi:MULTISPECIES: single-stranded-DNA-specific exonuclease RecJ [Weeksella]|uniref:Single-stranded-DNA-specific exonuclease RecJ n=1 Tax=Weeksella virosa (strain ATCC 43766 / DSM 16922 / JCM 21250 / CCUG 30538 / CDC 9751 / IAM 14551 / NBRC 16016 / NCTC 11634 / CL345/78) TaxID=865938 RepID=F0NXJ2_WEEVC|nr:MULTISPECIES: single-stranded-DNA-specific exonuclease RecJ [Weeksella]ADX67982.1 single-stranded-DNA-specific exonuclease RecJ [Weeksella virosa DSM 16922]MDK7375793.1 single-stranded-DNA-specific exonuclease RecJ [Weeksella virosa]MDK7676161.1 single-stranded-DNA-specific exonuclease RecJ [Weeksella virosa]OFM83775.1 single-stranded-DNA-specific exonuclease RecJ [Weeksella sp. HMSC059D05]VEH64384.1 Single-stranded-DNA-specific exonuclease recJ [Weeksella virosa]